MGAPMQEQQQVQTIIEVPSRRIRPHKKPDEVNWSLWIPVIVASITTLGGIITTYISMRVSRRKKVAAAVAAEKSKGEN